MPTMTVYLNGSSAHIPGSGTHERAPRGVVDGWSKGATRRLRNWLYGVDVQGLSGFGYAVTLTMKLTPENGEAMHALRTSWLKRVQRSGVTLARFLWIVEWQARGTPHFHLALYFDQELDDFEQWKLLRAWVEVSAAYGSKLLSQTMEPITGAKGWLEYLSKHSARGRMHYQRQGKPEGWEKTGRLWGQGGDWPLVEPVKYQLDREAYWHFRRLVRSWRIAAARVGPNPGKRIVGARRLLQRSDRKLGAVAGVSEFMSYEDVSRILDVMVRQGYQVDLLRQTQDEGIHPISGTVTPERSGGVK